MVSIHLSRGVTISHIRPQSCSLIFVVVSLHRGHYTFIKPLSFITTVTNPYGHGHQVCAPPHRGDEGDLEKLWCKTTSACTNAPWTGESLLWFGQTFGETTKPTYTSRVGKKWEPRNPVPGPFSAKIRKVNQNSESSQKFWKVVRKLGKARG